MIEINSIVPNFSLIGSDKKEHSLSEYKGKKIILYFYPRDNTPGCSTEACDFRDNNSIIEDMNTIVIGVSRDSLKSHDKFIEKFNLPFLLLSDEDETLCNLFGVIKEKNMYGKKTLGLVRSTFVFDKNGKLTHAQRNLRAKDYADRLLETLA